MKQILLFIMMLFTINVIAQSSNQGKTKFRTMERCLDSNGDPIEGCLIVSRANGTFNPKTLDDFVIQFNAENESAVDSIWTSNDTLYVTYFNAPRLGYKANGLNGIFAASNNNKPILATTALLNPNTDWRINNGISGNGLFSFQVKEGFRQVWITNSWATSPAQLRLSGTNQANVDYIATSRTWRLGNSVGAFNLIDVTGNITPFAIQTTPTLNNTLYLKNNGDILFGGYTSARPFSVFPKNFTGLGSDGTLQMYEIQDLIDTISNDIPATWLKGTISNDIPESTDTAYREGVTWVHDNPLIFSRSSTGGYFGIVNPIQTNERNSDFLFSMNTTDNAGSTRDNTTVGIGFNLGQGGGAAKSGLSGIGLSFEDHYEPTPGDSIAEYHTFFIDGAGAQNRLESYTIRKANKNAWENYYTLDKTYWKDPNNGNQWLIFERGNTTSCAINMLGSSTGTGVQLAMDAANTNFQIYPNGMPGTLKGIYMDQFELFGLSTISGVNYGAGNAYTYQKNGAFVSANDNLASLGLISNRFNNLHVTSIHATHASNSADEIFTLDGSGEIRISKFPNTRDDGAPVNFLGTNLTGLLQSYPASTFVTQTQLSANKFAATFGGEPSGEYNIVHNLGSLDIIVQVYDIASGEDQTVNCSIIRQDVNTVHVVGPITDPASARIVILK